MILTNEYSGKRFLMSDEFLLTNYLKYLVNSDFTSSQWLVTGEQ